MQNTDEHYFKKLRKSRQCKERKHNAWRTRWYMSVGVRTSVSGGWIAPARFKWLMSGVSKKMRTSLGCCSWCMTNEKNGMWALSKYSCVLQLVYERGEQDRVFFAAAVIVLWDSYVFSLFNYRYKIYSKLWSLNFSWLMPNSYLKTVNGELISNGKNRSGSWSEGL